MTHTVLYGSPYVSERFQLRLERSHVSPGLVDGVNDWRYPGNAVHCSHDGQACWTRVTAC